MELTLNILILPLLAVIVYQDFRFRAISWFTLPLLFVAFAINSILSTDFNLFLRSFLFNIGFIVFQLFAVTAYFSIKNRAITNITSKHIGWGDILFFTVAAAIFTPVNFILFYLLTLITTLIIAVAYRLIKRDSTITIPLAGAMALLLLVFYSFSNFSNAIDLHNDQFLLSALVVPL